MHHREKCIQITLTFHNFCSEESIICRQHIVELLRPPKGPSCAHCVKSMKFGTLMYFYMLNHLRKGHKLIGHPFGRNLHKSNMADTCQEIGQYFKHACICYIFMRFKLYFSLQRYNAISFIQTEALYYSFICQNPIWLPLPELHNHENKCRQKSVSFHNYEIEQPSKHKVII